MKTLKLITLLAVAALIFSSCGNRNSQSDESSSGEFDLAKYVEAAEAITPSLDKIDQVFQILDIAEAKYYPILTNDPVKALDYKTSYPIAAANLGVFMLDIVYDLYGKDEEAAYRAFGAAQELAKYVGIESAFAVTTFESLEGKAMSRDSTAMIYNDLMKQSQKYTSEKEILFVHTAFITGVYAEKVYIISSLLQQLLESEELSQEEEISVKELLVIHINQIKSVNVLLNAVESQADQLKSVVLLENLQDLRKLATSIEAEEESMLSASPTELRDNELLNNSFNTVKKIRTLIVTAG